MKTIYVISILFFVVVCFSSCKKENLNEGLSSTNSNSEKELKQTSVPYSTLVYIGNSTWQGVWSGISITFQGPTDTQLMDGKQHHYTLLEAKGGSWAYEYTEVGGNSWSIHQIVLTYTGIAIPKVTWTNKSTGNIFPTNPETPYTIINPTGYERKVSTYKAQTYSMAGLKYIDHNIMVVQVGNQLEIVSSSSSNSPVSIIP